MTAFYNLNGNILHSSDEFPRLARTADTHVSDFGEGVFETLRLTGDSIPLLNLHLDRAFQALHSLGFTIPPSFTEEFFLKQIVGLARKNNHQQQTRTRIIFYRKKESIQDLSVPDFLVQTWDLNENYYQFNTSGYQLLLYKESQKKLDEFCNLKLNARIPYFKSMEFARTHNAEDALVLNQKNRIADASIANVFWVKDGSIFTTPLSEGPVAGVMRRWLLENMSKAKFNIAEKIADEQTLSDADEIFLTNALYGIRWVGSFNNKIFGNAVSAELYNRLILPLFNAGSSDKIPGTA